MHRSLFACLLLAPLAASAQTITATTDDGHTRAIAAGYKALTLCSAHFNGGRSAAQIEALELRGIYPEYEAQVHALSAQIDEAGKTVSVAFDPQLPPRVALWRSNLGCTQLPIGAGIEAIPRLPRFDAAAPDLDAQPWPRGERNATARIKGNAKALNNTVSAAFAAAQFGNGTETTAVLVLHNDRIVAEQYRDGFGPHVPQRTWSVAKSLAGSLIGVAAGQGLIDPAAPAPLPQWQVAGDPRAAITTGQLLRMSSGLYSATAGNRTDDLYFGGATVAETAPSAPLQATPGTRFRYANNDTVLAIHGLRARIGDDARALTFPYTELFWPLGMTRTYAETDWQGGFVISSQVWTTARDLARFGLLYQHDGVFAGKRLLPEGWVAYVTDASGPQPEGEFGYGATFWRMANSAGVPADSFAAFGNRGQYVVVVPSRNVVIVRRGEDPTGKRFDIAGFTAAVLKSLQ